MALSKWFNKAKATAALGLGAIAAPFAAHAQDADTAPQATPVVQQAEVSLPFYDARRSGEAFILGQLSKYSAGRIIVAVYSDSNEALAQETREIVNWTKARNPDIPVAGVIWANADHTNGHDAITVWYDGKPNISPLGAEYTPNENDELNLIDITTRGELPLRNRIHATLYSINQYAQKVTASNTAATSGVTVAQNTP